MPDLKTTLESVPVPQTVKADAWDAYQASKDASELAAKLATMPLPRETKAQLWDMKQAEVPAIPQTPAVPQQPGIVSQVGKAFGDLAGGIGASVYKTGEGAYDLIRKIPGADKVLPEISPEMRQLAVAPDSFNGKLGDFAGDAAAFALGTGEVNTAVKAAQLAGLAQRGIQGAEAAAQVSKLLPKLTRIGADALAAGGVTGVQTGGNLPAMALSTGLTGATGGAIAGVTGGGAALIEKLVNSSPRPLSPNVIRLADRYGIKLSQGAAGGSKFTQGAQKILSSTVAPDLFETRAAENQQGVQTAITDFTNGFGTDAHAAGQHTLDSLLDSANEYHGQAEANYNQLARAEAAPENQRAVQVGTKTVNTPVSTIFNSQGRPVTTAGPNTVPVMESMGMPVDLRPVKPKLQAIIDSLTMGIRPVDQRADPVLAAAQALQNSADHMPASKVERLLGYLKDAQAGRTQASPLAKKMAGDVINALEPQIQSAVKQAGPDSVNALEAARANWARRSAVLDTVKQLAGDTTGQGGQARVFSKLTMSRDANYPLLADVLSTAPEIRGPLAEGFLAEHVFKSAADGSEFISPKEARRVWNRLGRRTAAAIYTPEQIQDVNDFLTLTERLAEDPNPTQHAWMSGIMRGLGLITHPIGGGAAIGLGRRAAWFLLNPDRTRMLRRALTTTSNAEREALVNSLVKAEREADAGIQTAAPVPPKEPPAPPTTPESGPVTGQGSRPPEPAPKPATIRTPDTPAEIASGANPLTPASATLTKDQLREIAPEATNPQPGDVAKMDPRGIIADPARFQFKRDTGGAAGVGDELKAVKKYDPEMGGVLSVWRDPADGKTYVVNGHHRLELAKRANAPEVTVRYLEAATASQARTKGALINMAEGRGTALDAAKVMREGQISPEDLEAKGVSLKGAVARDGAALSRLSPPLFDQVISGDLPVARGAIIGAELPSHADQAALMEATKGKHLTNEELKETIDFLKGAGKKDAAEPENMSLFGDVEPEQQRAIFEMAKLSNYVRKRIGTEKKLFGIVADAAKAEALESAGNKLATSENAERAQSAERALAVYDKLKASAGAINDALRNGAESLGKKGAPAKEVSEHTYQRVRAAIERELGAMPEIREARRPTGAVPGQGTFDFDGQGTLDFDAEPAKPATTTPAVAVLEPPNIVTRPLDDYAAEKMTDHGPGYGYLSTHQPINPNLADWKLVSFEAPGGTSGYVLNEHAFQFLMRAIGVGRGKALGFFTDAIEAAKIGRLMRNRLSQTGRLYDLSERLATTTKPVVVALDYRGLDTRSFADTLQHEFFHALQFMVGSPEAKAMDGFLASSPARTAATSLRAMGYTSYKGVRMLDEIGVRLMQSGKGSQLGLGKPSFDVLKRHYLSILPDHEPQYLDQMGRILGKSTHD